MPRKPKIKFYAGPIPIRRPGAFREKARRAGMTTLQYARRVLRKGSRASKLTKQQARAALALRKMSRRK